MKQKVLIKKKKRIFFCFKKAFLNTKQTNKQNKKEPINKTFKCKDKVRWVWLLVFLASKSLW